MGKYFHVVSYINYFSYCVNCISKYFEASVKFYVYVVQKFKWRLEKDLQLMMCNLDESSSW